jgi:hypothetical protein
LSLRIKLIFLGILAVVASIIKPPLSLYQYPISLWSPLEFIAKNNRWICIGISLFIIIILLGRTRYNLSAFYSLIALHFLFLLKNSMSIFFESLPFFVGFMSMLIANRAMAFQAIKSIEKAKEIWLPVTSASLLFIAINSIQYYINPSATFLVSGRYHGVTSNPLMFALSSAIIIPALLYQYHRSSIKFKLIYIISFIILLYFIYLTGSRLGLIIIVLSVALFYRSKYSAALNFAIALMLVLAIWTIFSENIIELGNSRIFTFKNTRADVWEWQLKTILKYPLWGIELDYGKRLEFGENSYFAAGVAGGFPGIILIGIFTFSIIAKLKRLLTCERVVGWRPETSLAISILGTCLVAAFGEGFFLGIFTFPLILLIYTVSISDALVMQLLSQKKETFYHKK